MMGVRLQRGHSSVFVPETPCMTLHMYFIPWIYEGGLSPTGGESHNPHTLFQDRGNETANRTDRSEYGYRPSPPIRRA